MAYAVAVAGLFASLWLYERYRPRPIIARFQPESERVNELQHHCVELADRAEEANERATDLELELKQCRAELWSAYAKLRRFKRLSDEIGETELPLPEYPMDEPIKY